MHCAGSAPYLRVYLAERIPAAREPTMSSPLPSSRTGWASLRDLNGYQWFVFIVCCMAWDMDCMDQQLFVLARRPAMMELVPKPAESDPRWTVKLAEITEQTTAAAVKESKPAPTETELKQKVLASLHDADVAWSAAWYAACAESGVDVPFVIVTRTGWRDPRSDVRREWSRLRRRSFLRIREMSGHGIFWRRSSGTRSVRGRRVVMPDLISLPRTAIRGHPRRPV